MRLLMMITARDQRKAADRSANRTNSTTHMLTCTVATNPPQYLLTRPCIVSLTVQMFRRFYNRAGWKISAKSPEQMLQTFASTHAWVKTAEDTTYPIPCVSPRHGCRIIFGTGMSLYMTFKLYDRQRPAEKAARVKEDVSEKERLCNLDVSAVSFTCVTYRCCLEYHQFSNC